MASFKSILSDIGGFLKKAFTDATKVAQAAEPIVDKAFPGIGDLYNATVTAVINAENAAVAAGAQTGSGATKLSLVVNAIESEFNSFASSIGIESTATATEGWVNAVVASLNAIPSSTSTTSTTAS